MQSLAIRYTERLADAGVVSSVESRGDSYDNALAESFNGLYKTELIRPKAPWRGLDDVEFATLEYLDWFNHPRLHGETGMVPPAEFERPIPSDRHGHRDRDSTEPASRKPGAVHSFVPTEQVTCEWVDHPDQRHKRIRESNTGGLNTYRAYHDVTEPLRFHSSIGSPIDEFARYSRTRGIPATPSEAGLKILLVGELAFNPDRILALEERGHQLYGLWTPTPADFNTVGPLPFGHVEDIGREGWQATVRHLKPDLIYALLNWQAVPWAHHVLLENPGVPFVWHFKEGPFFCLQKGTWPQLADLHTRSDGRIYASAELRDWFEAALPDAAAKPTLALDGDLPKREWFDGDLTPRLSDEDGEIHTVLAGRPMGIAPEDIAVLARNGVHFHFYGEVFHRLWEAWIDEANRLAPGYLHLHPLVDQHSWVSEFSRYDAGWLHTFASANGGEIRRAVWDDLNYPARLSTLAAAGLPMIQRNNRGSIVATQTLARQLDCGVFFDDIDDLAARLRDGPRMTELRRNMAQHRDLFTFDRHTDDLIAFFHEVIATRS